MITLSASPPLPACPVTGLPVEWRQDLWWFGKVLRKEQGEMICQHPPVKPSSHQGGLAQGQAGRAKCPRWLRGGCGGRRGAQPASLRAPSLLVWLWVIDMDRAQLPRPVGNSRGAATLGIKSGLLIPNSSQGSPHTCSMDSWAEFMQFYLQIPQWVFTVATQTLNSVREAPQGSQFLVQQIIHHVLNHSWKCHPVVRIKKV